MEQLLTIDVLGQPFTFKTDSNSSEAEAVADYVVKTVDMVETHSKKGAPSLDKRAILILAALNITSELFHLKRKHQELLQSIDKRSTELIDLLESKISMKTFS